jgi:hypothetical protein
MYLVIVIAAGVATAWWAGHKIGMDLSSIQTAAQVLGLTETGRLTHGTVGYIPSVATKQQPAQPVAPYCNPGQTPVFANAMAALKAQVGNSMGTPVECEHAVSPTGDTVQQTSTGLAAYSRITNTVSFTDGWHHWAITPRGFLQWEGSQPDPPTG